MEGPKGNCLLPQFLEKGMKLTDLTLVKCGKCDTMDYVPKNSEIDHGKTFNCFACFLKSGKAFTAIPLVVGAAETLSPSTSNSAEEISDQPMEWQIKDVRSLNGDLVLKDQDDGRGAVMEMVDLEGTSTPPLQGNGAETVTNSVLDLPADRNAENEGSMIGQEGKVSAWTSQGYLTFCVPSDFEKETQTFKLVSGQNTGTAEDPIVIDDNCETN